MNAQNVNSSSQTKIIYILEERGLVRSVKRQLWKISHILTHSIKKMKSKRNQMMTPKLQKIKTGIILPTYEPDDLFDGLLPTIKYVSNIKDTVVWLMNFNGPKWTTRFIRFAVEKIKAEGFEVRHIYTGTWKQPVKLISMRTYCAKLGEHDCELFLFIDDDFKFVESTPSCSLSSGDRYEESIDYMSKFPRCGVINTKSFLGGYKQGLKIINTTDDMYATNRGLFLRNMRDHGFLLAPKWTHDLAGGLEETLMVMARIELGYFCAKQMNNPTIHITGKLSDYDNTPSDFHNIELINQNIGAYLKSRYGDWEWLYEEKRFPKTLWDSYLDHGGPDIKYWDPDYTIDYGEIRSRLINTLNE
jgi:hypothetical protein